MSDWKRLDDRFDAIVSEWIRTVEENDELQAELSALRRRFGLPVSRKQAVRWVERNEGWLEEMVGEIGRLIDRHGIRKEWETELRLYLMTNERPHLCVKSGISSRREYDEDTGEATTKIQFDAAKLDPKLPHYDFWRRRAILKSDPPPQPKKVGKAVDWRPVAEWHMRHPIFTVEELAEILGYNYTYLSSRIADAKREIDSWNP